MKKTTKNFQVSSGNVFADLGLPNPEQMLAKAELGLKINRLIKKKKFSQKAVAQLLSIDQQKISLLAVGKLSEFSVETLFKFLTILGRMPIKKVIAAIIHKDGKYLLAQRAKKDFLYGKWEFPGGKLEEGETHTECLARELMEEFSITARIGNYFCSSYFEHEGQPMEMRVYFVNSSSGEFVLNDHQQIKWVERNELLDYDMPDPDKPIVEKLLE